MMGSPKNEQGRTEYETQHKVTLSQGFWLAETTVTQELWQAVMDDNPSCFNDNPANPVEQVSWQDAQEFVIRLNDLVPGLLAQLPTEAQWEYGCRAGTTQPFSFGNTIIPSQVNYNGEYPYAYRKKGQYREKTVPVKSLPPNSWGLYEMHGNVWEWCEDAWQANLGNKLAIDPLPEGASEGGEGRVLRGGSWRSKGGSVRSAYRYWYVPDDRSNAVGFRLSLAHIFANH